MSSDQPGSVRDVSGGGITGEHPRSDAPNLFVGPTTTDEFNTIRLQLLPVACWRVDDIRFAFDSSFVSVGTAAAGAADPDDIRAELVLLSTLVKAHPGSPLSVFGHADPVGTDDYNKLLSGRRASAIYAILIAKSEPGTAVGLWQQIAAKEQWGADQRDPMRAFTGLSSAAPDSTLFKTYMQQLCPADLTLGKKDFLAQGADAGGKGDYQGCGEFNPLLLFSKEKEDEFAQAKERNDAAGIAKRNAANAPNRRVMVLLFRKGSKIDPTKWPCPRVLEGVDGCIKRFFSDGNTRRGAHLPGVDRRFEDKKDTFACRFYQRISTGSPCDVIPPPLVPPKIEIILDKNKDHVVDETEPVAEFVRIGLWDQAYDAAGNVLNNAAEDRNFIGSDFRRFYFRVTDTAATTPTISINWKSLKSDKSDDDAPASQVLTLLPTRAGSKVYVSKAVMLVTDDTDRKQATDSGLTGTLPDVGVRNQGQSNHRLRRAGIDGFVRGEYQSRAFPLSTVELPVFKRNPDERRRVSTTVINYGNSATAAYIADQFTHANQHWNRVGIQIDAGAATVRATPAGVLNGAGLYAGSLDNAPEQAALADLIPIATDDTLTIVFVPLTGANAYSTIGQRTRSALGDRYFIFMNTTLALTDETLAHELHHVLFNRFDTAVAQQFFTFNTNPPGSFGIALPDDRVYGRVQNLNSADPDNDVPNDNIINWVRRQRTARFPIAPGTSGATATTGNHFAKNF